MCTEKNCHFRSCSDFLDSPIYCKSMSDISHCPITEDLTSLQGGFSASTFMSNHLTSEVFFSTSTTGYYDSDQSSSTNGTQQMSSNFVLLYQRKIVVVF